MLARIEHNPQVLKVEFDIILDDIIFCNNPDIYFRKVQELHKKIFTCSIADRDIVDVSSDFQTDCLVVKNENFLCVAGPANYEWSEVEGFDHDFYYMDYDQKARVYIISGENENLNRVSLNGKTCLKFSDLAACSANLEMKREGSMVLLSGKGFYYESLSNEFLKVRIEN